MFLLPFSKSISSQTTSKRRAQPQRQKHFRRARLLLEQLETRLTLSNTGTVHLTDSTATIVEETHYAAKTDVYAYGKDLVDGYYDVEVVAPGGKSGNAPTHDILGLSNPNDPVQVSGGHFDLTSFPTPVNPAPGLSVTVTGPRGNAFNVWDVVYSTGSTKMDPPAGSQGYDDTRNPGGEYQVVLAQHIPGEIQDNFSQFTGNNAVTKSKNFKVEVAPTATQIIVTKDAIGTDGSTTSFSFTDNYAGGGFNLVGGQSNNSGPLTAGIYTITEGTEPANWGYTNVVWGTTPGGDDLGSSLTTTATVGLTAGETVYVTFTDTRSIAPEAVWFSTTPSAPTIPLGTTAPTLTDTPTLNGQSSDAGGTITFTLYNPSHTLVDTEPVNVNGTDHTYTTPTGNSKTATKLENEDIANIDRCPRTETDVLQSSIFAMSPLCQMARSGKPPCERGS
jgi:hypothetical protein